MNLSLDQIIITTQVQCNATGYITGIDNLGAQLPKWKPFLDIMMFDIPGQKRYRGLKVLQEIIKANDIKGPLTIKDVRPNPASLRYLFNSTNLILDRIDQSQDLAVIPEQTRDEDIIQIRDTVQQNGFNNIMQKFVSIKDSLLQKIYYNQMQPNHSFENVRQLGGGGLLYHEDFDKEPDQYIQFKDERILRMDMQQFQQQVNVDFIESEQLMGLYPFINNMFTSVQAPWYFNANQINQDEQINQLNPYIVNDIRRIQNNNEGIIELFESFIDLFEGEAQEFNIRDIDVGIELDAIDQMKYSFKNQGYQKLQEIYNYIITEGNRYREQQYDEQTIEQDSFSQIQTMNLDIFTRMRYRQESTLNEIINNLSSVTAAEQYQWPRAAEMLELDDLDQVLLPEMNQAEYPVQRKLLDLMYNTENARRFAYLNMQNNMMGRRFRETMDSNELLIQRWDYQFQRQQTELNRTIEAVSAPKQRLLNIQRMKQYMVSELFSDSAVKWIDSSPYDLAIQRLTAYNPDLAFRIDMLCSSYFPKIYTLGQFMHLLNVSVSRLRFLFNCIQDFFLLATSWRRYFHPLFGLFTGNIPLEFQKQQTQGKTRYRQQQNIIGYELMISNFVTPITSRLLIIFLWVDYRKRFEDTALYQDLIINKQGLAFLLHPTLIKNRDIAMERFDYDNLRVGLFGQVLPNQQTPQDNELRNRRYINKMNKLVAAIRNSDIPDVHTGLQQSEQDQIQMDNDQLQLTIGNKIIINKDFQRIIDYQLTQEGDYFDTSQFKVDFIDYEEIIEAIKRSALDLNQPGQYSLFSADKVNIDRYLSQDFINMTQSIVHHMFKDLKIQQTLTRLRNSPIENLYIECIISHENRTALNQEADYNRSNLSTLRFFNQPDQDAQSYFIENLDQYNSLNYQERRISNIIQNLYRDEAQSLLRFYGYKNDDQIRDFLWNHDFKTIRFRLQRQQIDNFLYARTRIDDAPQDLIKFISQQITKGIFDAFINMHCNYGIQEDGDPENQLGRLINRYKRQVRPILEQDPNDPLLQFMVEEQQIKNYFKLIAIPSLKVQQIKIIANVNIRRWERSMSNITYKQREVIRQERYRPQQQEPVDENFIQLQTQQNTDVPQIINIEEQEEQKTNQPNIQLQIQQEEPEVIVIDDDDEYDTKNYGDRVIKKPRVQDFNYIGEVQKKTEDQNFTHYRKQQQGINIPCLFLLNNFIAKKYNIQIPNQEVVEKGLIIDYIQLLVQALADREISIYTWAIQFYTFLIRKDSLKQDYKDKIIIAITDYHVYLGDFDKINQYTKFNILKQNPNIQNALRPINKFDNEFNARTQTHLKKESKLASEYEKINKKRQFTQNKQIQSEISKAFMFPGNIANYPKFKSRVINLYFDFETTSEINKTTETFCACVYGEYKHNNQDMVIQRIFTYPSPEDKLCQWLLELLHNNKDTKFQLIGWNNSRFDNFFLIQALDRSVGPNQYEIVGDGQTNSKIIFIGQLEVIDLCLTVNAQLSEACANFGISEEDGGKQNFQILDYPDIPRMLQNEAKIVQYCMQDCKAVLQVHKRFVQQMNKLYNLTLNQLLNNKQETNIDIELMKLFTGEKNVFDTLFVDELQCPRSVTQLAEKFIGSFKFNNQKQLQYFLGNKDEQQQVHLRNSYKGGLNQAYNLSKYKDQVWFGDVTSLYPFVMSNYMLPYRLKEIVYMKDSEDMNEFTNNQTGEFFSDCIYLVSQWHYKPLEQKNVGRIPLNVGGRVVFIRQFDFNDKNEYINLVKQQIEFQNDMNILDQDFIPIWGFELVNKSYFQSIRVERVIRFEFYEQKIGFQYIIDSIFKIKQQAEIENNKTLRQLAKLILNSMYGFFGKRDYDYIKLISSAEWNMVQHQNRHVDLLKVQDNAKYKAKVNEEYKDVINFDSIQHVQVVTQYDGKKYLKLNFGSQFNKFKSGSLVYLASFITARARTYMWECIHLSGAKYPIYMDTDSLILLKDQAQKLQENGKLGGELGLFKNEMDPQNSQSLKLCPVFKAFGKKVYCITDIEEQKLLKCAFRGQQKQDVKIKIDELTKQAIKQKSFELKLFKDLADDLAVSDRFEHAGDRRTFTKKQGQMKNITQHLIFTLKPTLKIDEQTGQGSEFENYIEFCNFKIKHLIHKKDNTFQYIN